jgi:hypothetical protein
MLLRRTSRPEDADLLAQAEAVAVRADRILSKQRPAHDDEEITEVTDVTSSSFAG